MNYHLKLRQSTGFLGSLFFLMGKGDISIPDYTTLCRRQKDVPVEISQRLSGTLFLGKRWDLNLSINITRFILLKVMVRKKKEINGLGKDENFHYANVQGNKGYARLSLTTQRINYKISNKFNLSLEQLTYLRKTHYDYLEDVETISTETRLRLTYNILNM